MVLCAGDRGDGHCARPTAEHSLEGAGRYRGRRDVRDVGDLVHARPCVLRRCNRVRRVLFVPGHVHVDLPQRAKPSANTG